MPCKPLDSSHPDYTTLAPIVAGLLEHGGGFTEFEKRVPALLRQTFDEVIDAPRTNRFTLAEIEKTEKTYLGTKVEILIRNYLNLPHGKILDMLVDGIEVDIKMTTARDWMIPRESIDRPALLCKANEKTSLCDVGVILCRREYLRNSRNQDSKGQIAAANYINIWWILKEHPYPENFWERLSMEDRLEIVNAGSGTRRLAALFQKIQCRPISRIQVQALAQQHDYMKRIRRNGGARDILAPQGIALLWGSRDRAIIDALGLGIVSTEEFISYSPRTEQEERILRDAGHID